jgi:hypothetical protein
MTLIPLAIPLMTYVFIFVLHRAIRECGEYESPRHRVAAE